MIRFGVFEFDYSERELRKRGRRIKLQEKQVQVLAFLLEQPGRIVSREALRHRVWPDGRFIDFDRSINKAIHRLRLALDDSTVGPKFIETVSGRGYRFIAPVEGRSSQTLPGDHSATMVVLPIENLSGDGALDCIADGTTDLLITAICQIRDLRVISKTSAMCYRSARKTLPQIARELGAQFVVEGSLLCSGSRVYISLRLHHGLPERQLWAESYEGSAGDAMACQARAVQDIKLFVQTYLISTCQQSLLSSDVTQTEAHEAYLRGRYLWNRRTGRDLLRSFELYRRAIKLNPDLALAHSGLADSFLLLGIWGMQPPRGAFPKALEAAGRAIRIDESLAEAHTALAEVRKDYHWDWDGAEREYRRAIRLNPTYATAHHWYAQLLSILGRHPEAIAEIQKARRLEPLSVPINAFVAYMHLAARQFDQAIVEAHQAIDLEPRSALAHWYLGRAYCFQEKWPEAIDALRLCAEFSSDLAFVKGSLALALRRAGQVTRARSVLHEVQQLSADQYVSPFHLAMTHLGLGNPEIAMGWLERAVDERASPVISIGDPEFDELQNEPRYRTLCTRLHLPLGGT